jgi:hypothetical protein
MKDESLTLTGWPAVPVFLMLAITQVLTALVMSLPITWLVNHVFSANAIHEIFASDRLGYPKNQYGHATQLDGLKWGDVPENVKDHVRGLAEKEIILIQTIPRTEVTKYLVTLFRELERLRPTICGAMSHGIAWDDKRESLVLLVNLGDFVYAHRLRPDDLTSDPIVTAASLMAKVEPELVNTDALT